MSQPCKQCGTEPRYRRYAHCAAVSFLRRTQSDTCDEKYQGISLDGSKTLDTCRANADHICDIAAAVRIGGIESGEVRSAATRSSSRMPAPDFSARSVTPSLGTEATRSVPRVLLSDARNLARRKSQGSRLATSEKFDPCRARHTLRWLQCFSIPQRRDRHRRGKTCRVAKQLEKARAGVLCKECGVEPRYQEYALCAAVSFLFPTRAVWRDENR